MFKKLILLLNFLSVVNVIIGSECESVGLDKEGFTSFLPKVSGVIFVVTPSFGPKAISFAALDPADAGYWDHFQALFDNCKNFGQVSDCCIIHNRTDMKCILELKIKKINSDENI